MNRFLPAGRGSRAATLVAAFTAMLLVSGPAPVAAGAGVAIAAQSGAAGQVALNPEHPQRYVVKRGDTLWDISAMFLRNPWYWPEIWYVNPQIANPHLIYPGDVLTLVYVDGKPQLRLERGSSGPTGTEKLSPRIREQDLDEAIRTIPLEVIGAFLRKGAVLEKDQIDQLPYVVAIRDGHLIGGSNNDLYVRGDGLMLDHGYSIVKIGEPLTDPDDGKVVGFEGIFVGEGTIRREGDPATLKLTRTHREALRGDRLLNLDFNIPLNFYPRAPEQDIDGSIIHVVDGITQISQYQVVVLNRGARDGLEPGHVLQILRVGGTVQDRFGDSRAFGEKVRLPDEPAGILMVFKTYDRISYALVMEATNEIHVLDRVRNPD